MTRTSCKIWSKLKIKPPERCQSRRSCFFIANFELISYLALVFSILDFEQVNARCDSILITFSLSKLYHIFIFFVKWLFIIFLLITYIFHIYTVFHIYFKSYISIQFFHLLFSSGFNTVAFFHALSLPSLFFKLMQQKSTYDLTNKKVW